MVMSRNAWIVVIAGTLLCLVSFGLRSTMGLFMGPVTETHGWTRSGFAFAIALQNLFWGLMAPLAGMLAERIGNVRVMIMGALIYAAGLALAVHAETLLGLSLTLGVLVGTGIAATAFGVCLPAMARMVPERHRGTVLGVGTAGGSAGQFAVVPGAQSLISHLDWQLALYWLAAAAIVMCFLALPLGRGDAGRGVQEQAHADQGTMNALREAFSTPSYWYIIAGFFVCGFQLAFITTHLPSFLGDRGLSASTGATAISIIGLCNIFGAYAAGVLSNQWSRKLMLFGIYMGRAAAITVFMLTPISVTSVYVFAAVTGLLWLATIPPTSGLVAHLFGTRHMALLYGIVFLNHQLGSFTGVWLGGYLYDTTGSYDIVWWASVVIAILSAILHLPVREQPVARLQKAVA